MFSLSNECAKLLQRDMLTTADNSSPHSPRLQRSSLPSGGKVQNGACAAGEYVRCHSDQVQFQCTPTLRKSVIVHFQ